jgi:hypothetical protein
VFLPQREERIAHEIARLAVAARGAGKAPKSVQLLLQRERTGASVEELHNLKEAAEAAGRHDGDIARARGELDNVLTLLNNLKDSRTVRLTAPLLNENEETLLAPGMVFQSAQETAANTLRLLQVAGVINLGGESYPTLSQLRQWWNDHKNQFGPVPKELQQIAPAASKSNPACTAFPGSDP